TEMVFTAICLYSASLLCWKENVLHKLVGTAASAFFLYTYDIAGVQAGSDKSLQIINEVLYYKGQAGVYAYSGGRPQLISNAFGTRQYHAAVGGADGWRYYLSMRDAQEDAHLFVYDTRRGLWLREDDTAAVQFAELSGTVYMLTEGGEILLPEAGGDERVTWYAELSPFTETVHNRKIYSKLLLRLTLDEGAHASVEVARDGGLWHKIWTGHRTGTVVVPVIPNRCDKFAVRLSGAGGCAVESMIRQFRTGGEV
ncbi:MAG: hypothetical protein LIO58_01235, partial [Oscillospiraceae bacterium]|nr:hypothetical protein [Oscillospiraceae bacterium]